MSVRLFVALDLPATARRALAAFRDEALDPAVWRPLPETSFHVTLAFLGHRDEADVARCVTALEAVEPAAPPLALGRALLLTRVFTVALEDPAEELASFQARVSGALARAGLYVPEARPFRPHVTLGRLRRGARPARPSGAGPEAVAFRGGPVVLYRSVPGRGGAAYDPLWSTVARG